MRFNPVSLVFDCVTMCLAHVHPRTLPLSWNRGAVARYAKSGAELSHALDVAAPVDEAVLESLEADRHVRAAPLCVGVSVGGGG